MTAKAIPKRPAPQLPLTTPPEQDVPEAEEERAEKRRRNHHGEHKRDPCGRAAAHPPTRDEASGIAQEVSHGGARRRLFRRAQSCRPSAGERSQPWAGQGSQRNGRSSR